ncbi:Panacea domain-containing protein [Companilactobacillus insicii]|uniref:Panacea domain-containing protein n=1 Tax=Companilactobacillus insicii TaxID=1732567 RepID=UPI000F76683A|nr:type II toxin-antitoxin system antitoxin SocA domain-containing protein [Companilactobacillus insicii]
MYDVMKVVNWMRVKNFAELRTDDFAEELTQMKVMKLLYYVQGTSLIYLGKRMFPQDIIAWKYGPAVSKVHDRYAGKREIVGEISDTDRDDYKELNSVEKVSNVLNTVYDTFGNKSAIDLMKQTHKESPWKNTEQSEPISDEEMINYFKKIVVNDEV